jgi:hypothetical protein
VVVSAKSLNEFTLGLFILLTTLYYFFRFQWGWDTWVVAFQVGLLCLFSLGGFLVWLISPSRLTKGYNIYSVGLAYLIFLLFLTALHGGVNGVAYGLKDHILPFMLLFYYSLVIKEIKLEKIFVMIGFCAAIVSVIYLAEFVNKWHFGNGFFAYTEGIKALTERVQGEESTSLSWVGDLLRMPGPLSHHNSTGLFMGVGVLSAMALFSSRHRKVGYIIFGVCLVGLLISGARTAWAATLAGIMFAKKDNIRNIIIYFAIAGVFFMVMAKFIPGVSELVKAERLVAPGRIILQKTERLYEPHYLKNIFMGNGFNYPGMDLDSPYSPLLSDDLFFIQLVTTYGLLPAFVFFWCVFSRKYRVPEEGDLGVYSLAIIILFLVSGMHTNAMKAL